MFILLQPKHLAFSLNQSECWRILFPFYKLFKQLLRTFTYVYREKFHSNFIASRNVSPSFQFTTLNLLKCWAFFCCVRPIACRFFNKAETSRIIVSSMRIVSSLNAFYALKHFTPMFISNKMSLHISYLSVLTRI